MKITTAAIAATTISVAIAQPHAHLHRHQHAHPHPVKRAVTVTTTSQVGGPTAYVYVLDGQGISLSQVCAGIESGQLKFADGSGPAGICNQVSTTTGTAKPTAGAFYHQNTTSTSTTSLAPASSLSVSVSVSASASASSAAPSSWSGTNVGSGSGTGLTAQFPDGTIDCSTFPSSYGAVPLDYLGLGGWSGLQAVTIAGEYVTNIVTGVSGQTCVDGMMCSYACPPGYQKAHWPSQQGSTGQSVGGIQCKGGKLYLTNPGLSTSLCIPGVGGVQAQNKAGGVVSICRTDYPGTESETIPVELQPGDTKALACPDAATYYSWQGKSTSAQYYLNPIGTSASVGCQWGQAGGSVGNYAPMNFGVGAKDGKTWLSIFPNTPTTTATFQGTVTIQGDLSGQCTYSNGQFCMNGQCSATGCTVSVLSGTATFLISN